MLTRNSADHNSSNVLIRQVHLFGVCQSMPGPIIAYDWHGILCHARNNCTYTIIILSQTNYFETRKPSIDMHYMYAVMNAT